LDISQAKIVFCYNFILPEATNSFFSTYQLYLFFSFFSLGLL
jgi:hypothetical protein